MLNERLTKKPKKSGLSIVIDNALLINTVLIKRGYNRLHNRPKELEEAVLIPSSYRILVEIPELDLTEFGH